MKKRNLICLIIIFILVLIILILMANNLIEKDLNDVGNDKKCGIENCHGLDIKCGNNVPEVCTEIYVLGDKCRQYAICQNIDGECKLVENNQFNECKSCVDKCSSDFKNDQVKIFECESEC